VARAEFISDLVANGVKINNLPSKDKIIAPEKRDNKQGEVRIKFLNLGQDLGRKLGPITPEILAAPGGGAIETQIANFDKALDEAWRKIGLSDDQIINANMALLSDSSQENTRQALHSYYQYSIDKADKKIKMNKNVKRSAMTMQLRADKRLQQDVNIARLTEEKIKLAKKLKAIKELEKLMGLKQAA
jgi:hypothetical protein